MLGPLEVREGDRAIKLGGYRQRLVLAVLLVHPEQAVSADRMIDAVWGEEPPRTARKTLQVYISRLRGLLGHEVIEPTPHGYILHMVPDASDVHRFESLAVDGQRLLASDPVAAAGLFRRSLAEWRGMPWGELGDELAIVPEAQRLRELRLSVLEARISADLESGGAPGLISELEGLVDEHPLRERFRYLLMLALYRSGRQADALRVFSATRQVLGEELGIEPSREIQDLEEKILLQDPSIEGPTTTTPTDDWTLARNPYKGLRTFVEEDAENFFGRTDLIAEIFDAINTRSLVAVVGASGSGKSSAVLAGVLPRLRMSALRADQRWLAISMVPGHHPFDEFEAGVRRSTQPDEADALPITPADSFGLLRAVQRIVGDDDTHVLIVIDQFEELFHLVTDDTERTQFVRNLVEAVEDPHSRLTVLLTLRADFLDRALADPALGRLIESEMVPVLPLAPTELEAAAARPAERVGVYLEPELIAEIVADMTNQPGALPLFQYVLTQLFEDRTGAILTRSVYRKIGGLRGALAQRAEEVYRGLDDSQQAAAEQVFLRLVNVGDDDEASRRRVDRQELDTLGFEGDAIKAALDAFDEARLLSFNRSPATGRATVEVAHEALLKEWPRLRVWLAEAQGDLRLHRALAIEVAQWDASQRAPGYLLTGARLGLYEDRSGRVELTQPESDFLEASIDRRNREEAAEEERRQQELRMERRSVRRLRWLVAVVSMAGLIAASLTVFATSQSRAAAASQREARARELANASLANLDTDPELATLLALESIEVNGSALREAEEALHLAVSASRLLAQHRGEWDVVFHPDGMLFVGGEEAATLIDPLSGEVLVEIAVPPDGLEVQSVAVSHDGSLLATGTQQIFIWDADSGTNIRRLAGSVGAVAAIAFSHDDQMIAALSIARGTGNLLVWEVATGDVIARDFDTAAWDANGPPVDLTFSPDGSMVAVTTFSGETFLEGEVKLLDIAAGEWGPTLRGHEGPASGVEYLPGGDTIVTASMDGQIRFWDAASGERITSFNTDVGQIVSLDISGNGDHLLIGGDGGALEYWALQFDSARLIAGLPGHRSWVAGVDIDAVGDRAVSVDLEGQVLVWDITQTGAGEVAAWPARRPIAFSGDGTLLATTDRSGRGVVVRRVPDWQIDNVFADVAPYVGRPNEEWGEVAGIALSPNGYRMVTATGSRLESVDAPMTLWNVETGKAIHTFFEHPFMKGPVVFSGDGTRVAVAICDNWAAPARVWDTESGDVVFSPPAAPCGQTVDLDSTGTLLAVQTIAEDQPNVQVWDTTTGELVFAVDHSPQWIGAVAFSPDDALLLTGGRDGTVRLWDVATGELVRTFTGHTGGVEDATWSEDGSMIATGSHDGTVRLWNPETGETLLVLGAHDTFSFVEISPDGRYLATGTDTGVRIWALDIDELIEIARTRVPRSLTAAECVAYYFEECP